MKKLINILSVFVVAFVSSMVLFASGIYPAIAVGLPIAAGSYALYKGLKGDPIALLYNLVVITLIAGAIEFVAPGMSMLAIGILFMWTLIPAKGTVVIGTLQSEVLKTIFTSDLQKILYPDNAFYKKSKADTDVALDAVSVEIPQESSRPKVLKNPEVRPIPVEMPKDLKKTYSVDLYETMPSLITNINQDFSTYDKRAAKLKTHANELQTRIAEEVGISWFPTLSSRKILTTGATGAVSKTGMSGGRLKWTLQDWMKFEYMLKRYIGDDGQFCIWMDAELKQDVLLIPEFRDFEKTGVSQTLATGAIGKILNMNVFLREGGLLADNSQAVKPYGSAIGANDRLTVLGWHPDFVRHAEGRNEVNIDPYVQPGMGGRRLNAAVRGGGCIERLDELGVAVMMQGIG